MFDQILGVNLSVTPKSTLLTTVLELIKKKSSFYVVTPNPEIITYAQSDPKFREILNNADFSLADGIGAIFAARLLGKKSIIRIPGRTFVLEILDLAKARNMQLNIFLLGADTSLKSAVARMKREFPSFLVNGEVGPMYTQDATPAGPINIKRHNEVLETIKKAKPNLVLVAFGFPKQEYWMSKYIKEIPNACLIGVGGTLDIYSGVLKPSPKILSTIGLEWLWRLIQEPSRFYRIFTAVLVFPFIVLRDLLTNRKAKK